MISIIVCTYNRDKYIYQCLSNLAKNLTRYDWEIILVNNNSSDSTQSECERFHVDYPSVKFHYFMESTPGLSYARNRGMREAHGDWFVFLDDDSMVGGDYIEQLGQLLDRFPDAGAFGGAITPFFEDKTPAWLSKWSMGFVSAIDMGNDVIEFANGKYPIGANMGISRKVINEIGDFNTSLGRTKDLLLGGEEKDIFARIRSAKYSIYYFPNIMVKHCIPPRRTTYEFIKKLGYGVGVSEYLRTKSISRLEYVKRLILELIKWAGTLVIWLGYLISCQLPKGNVLILFRYNVSKGLLYGKKE